MQLTELATILQQIREDYPDVPTHVTFHGHYPQVVVGWVYRENRGLLEVRVGDITYHPADVVYTERGRECPA